MGVYKIKIEIDGELIPDGCVSCGEDFDYTDGIIFVAYFDPGVRATRTDPGEPAEVYCICRKCFKEIGDKL